MRTGSIALVLAAIALGAAGFALTREDPQPVRIPMRTDRVANLEAQVAELTLEVESLKAARPERIRPQAFGLPMGTRSAAEAEDLGTPTELTEGEQALKTIVDKAVDRKTKRVLDEMRIKANKKPAMDVFASMLELTKEQRTETERVVVEGQRQVHEILDTPAADGTNFMDELIEVVAKGMAQPGKNHGWGRWFTRVVSEKIPGTDVTYGARIDSVKKSMHAAFKREWSQAQYKEFQEWGVDPTEIQNVPNSPNEALLKRIVERARTLGAKLPDAN
jgi:hypothetical protein